MDQTQSDLLAFEQLRSLDQERKRLMGRYQMSRENSPERLDFAHQINECDEAINRLLGFTEQEQERNLARIMYSVARQQEQSARAQSRMAEREAGINQVTKGIGCFLLAGIVSALTYFAAGQGDSYYVFWGGMAWGAWMIISGIIRAKSR